MLLRTRVNAWPRYHSERACQTPSSIRRSCSMKVVPSEET